MDIQVRQLKKNDERTFQHIVEMFWVRIYKFATIYTMDEGVSQEIAQDTFLTLWEKRADLTSDTSIITYLMVVARNKCLDYLRKKQLDTVPIDAVSEDMIYVRHHQDVLEDKTSDLLLAKELEEIITKGFGRLPEKTRIVFEKSRLEGKMNKEIAEELGVSVKTVEFHITKALNQLRSEIPAEYYPMMFIFFWLSN